MEDLHCLPAEFMSTPPKMFSKLTLSLCHSYSPGYSISQNNFKKPLQLTCENPSPSLALKGKLEMSAVSTISQAPCLQLELEPAMELKAFSSFHWTQSPSCPRLSRISRYDPVPCASFYFLGYKTWIYNEFILQ